MASVTFPVRSSFIMALISILSRGIQDGQLDDAERVIAALRVLSPGLAAIDEFLPYIAIKRGFPRDALQMYSAVQSNEGKWHAMMALCLKLVGDPTWHFHATQAMEGGNSSSEYSQGLAAVLLGKELPVEKIVLTEQAVSGVTASTVPNPYLNYRVI